MLTQLRGAARDRGDFNRFLDVFLVGMGDQFGQAKGS